MARRKPSRSTRTRKANVDAMSDTADLKLDRNTLFREIGSSGLTRFGGHVSEEFLNELRGSKGIAMYREMRENHPVVNAVFFAIEMALRQVRWFAEAPSDDPADVEAKDFLDECLADMSFTWNDTLAQILTMLQYGFSLSELVYKVRRGREVPAGQAESDYDDGRIGWRKWLPIAQDTLTTGQEWIFDDSGGVQGVHQTAPPDYEIRTIPMEKLLLFRTTVAKNNPEGRSLCRGMYIPYYYSKNLAEIEGISAERMGTGVPVVYLGSDTKKSGTQSDLDFAKQLARDVRADEQTGVVIPYAKMGAGAKEGEGMLFELLSPPSRGAVDFDTVINRYDKRIALAGLAQFVMLGQESVGSFALSKDQSDIFVMALGAWAESIAQIVSRFAVPRLFRLNTFGVEELPKLTHSEIAVPDLAALADFINQLVGAKVLTPDDNLETKLREMAHLPPKLEQVDPVLGLFAPTPTVPSGELKAADPALGMDENQMADTTQIEDDGQGYTPGGQEATSAGAHAEHFQTLAQGRRARGGARYETATNEYQAGLEQIYTDWYTALSRKLATAPDDAAREALLVPALGTLERDLKSAGRSGLLDAMTLGAAGVALTGDGLAALADLVAQNDNFIESSLIPAIREKARAGLADPELVAGGVTAISGIFQTVVGRVASYSGGYWQALFIGVGDAVQQSPDADQLRVRVNLDPGATHCKSCPKLVGTYANWNDMLARSGIPSSIGRSECGASCRCYLTIETSPGSNVFERM